MKTRYFLVLAILPLTLAASYRDRVKQVDLVHDWTKDPNDQGFVEVGPWKSMCEVLAKKHTTIKVTDLSQEHDSNVLTYVVVFNKPQYLDVKKLKKFPLKKAVLFAWEPPVVQKNLYTDRFLSNFKRVYTWDDDLVDNKKFFKFYYPVLQQMRSDLPSFEERKLLTQVSGRKKSKHKKELYSQRLEVIRYFQEREAGEFEFYGNGWDKEEFRDYRGAPADKYEALKNYKFSVCYENMRDVKGYVTEKIFDCFATGTIPIYWGASNITDFIPKECFIDRRDFKDFDAVMEFIRTMDKETYLTYQKNIQAFLVSDKAKLFSEEMFKVIFLDAIRFP